MIEIPELFTSIEKIEKTRRLFLQKERCCGCEFCIEVCPRDVLIKSEELNHKLTYPPMAKDDAKCTFCQLCEYACPSYSIYVLEDVKT